MVGAPGAGLWGAGGVAAGAGTGVLGLERRSHQKEAQQGRNAKGDHAKVRPRCPHSCHLWGLVPCWVQEKRGISTAFREMGAPGFVAGAAPTALLMTRRRIGGSILGSVARIPGLEAHGANERNELCNNR